MNFRNLSAWSIRNPVVPIILFLGLTLAGILAFKGMKIQDNPDIEFPAVIVVINQPGAAPTEIEKQITQKIEASIRSIPGIDNITSTASEGSSQSVVQFAIGTDINGAVSEVKNKVDQARGELPEGILEPQVFKAEGGPDVIAYFAVAAEDMTIADLSWFIDDTVAKRLLSVPGMATVERRGGVNREITVTLDPPRMQALGVTAAQINTVLRQVNLNAAGGRAEVAGSRQSVRVLGNAQTAYQLSQTQVAMANGRAVKLADVANVKDAYSEIDSIAKVHGKQVVTFGINRARGESDVSVYDGAVEEMKKIEAERGGRVHFVPLFTSVPEIREQYNSSISAMIEGAILAVVVVFFFLRDWRATVVSALAIPLSAVPTFWAMSLMGFTLNTLSLLALGLVAGVLVDDAIVEIENIVRHIRMGKTAYQAAIDAADEIGLAVVATTFSIVAVFLPVGLMPGVSGQFFKNFGLTVVVAVLFSLAVARMITPMVAAYFLKSTGHAEHGTARWIERYMGVLRWTLDTSRAEAYRLGIVRRPGRWWYPLILIVHLLLAVVLFGAAAGGAGQGLTALHAPAVLGPFVGIAAGALAATVWIKLVNGAIGRFFHGAFGQWWHFMGERWRARLRDHRIWMVGVALGSFALTVVMFMVIPGQFFPDTDNDYSRVVIDMVPGTTIQQTEAKIDEVLGLVGNEPEVKLAMERITEGSGRVFMTLNKEHRLRCQLWGGKYLFSDCLRTSIEFERQLAPRLQQVPDARVYFQSFGGGGGSGRPISVMLSGSDSDQLQKTAQALVDQMSKLKEVVAPRISADMRRPELIITPQLDLAAQLGVTTQSLSQVIRIATQGEIDQNSAKFSLSDRQVPIRVKLPPASRAQLSTIENLPVPTLSGGSVPLSRVASISFGSGPTTIQRYNQSRRIFVGADLPEGVVKGTAMNAIKNLPIMKNLPDGVSNAPAGEDRWQAEMIGNFLAAVGAGVLLVFSVLVLLYHRFVSPLVNMGSLFLAPLGGLLLVALFGQAMSLPVLIGILMLLGIVAKNSILLIDFAIEEMAQGVGKHEAILEAGHKRAQPIVMTTVAMVAGMVPTAISLGGDGGWRSPMGTVVIGGLTLSTLLTLLLVPAAFSLADGLEKRLGPWLRRIFLTYDPAHSHAAPQPRPETVPAE
ncbi:MAG: efflux RND transporter permease subunit [Proteobacteria bacterium]|nr:efflux RND transporter permease subunit [Pseudomonadota bacterium]